MRKILILNFILLSNAAFALPSFDINDNLHGIEIVPLSKFNLTKEEEKITISLNNEQKNKGYIETKTDYPKSLLSTEETEKPILLNKSFKTNPYDTHIKKSLEDIKLNFLFNNISINKKNVIGYAPIGTWEKNGWNGIKVFFKDRLLGVCTYSYVKIIYVKLNQDVVRYDIHQQPTTIDIQGNNKDGFIYNISWYKQFDDKLLNGELECANMIYNPEITNKMVELANKLDVN